MELERKYRKAGALLILCSIVLRLVGTGVVGAFLSRPEVLSLVFLMETGRWIPPSEMTVPTQPPQTAPTIPPELPTEPTLPPTTQEPVKAVFGKDDVTLVQVNSACGYEADIQTLLHMPLSWDLTQGGPAVLILHSHGTESYTKTENYEESTPYRTLDAHYNVVSIGERIATLLEAGGISVLHDKQMHDYPSYSDSYGLARDSIAAYLQKYPSIRMVLDIHRDSIQRSDGTQIGYTVDVGQEKVAQLMMVVGTDAGGQAHPEWKQNMALATKLHAQLEKQTPGICRPISFRSQRFNQDMSAGAMLIEVGAAGNTRQQALLAAEQLAAGILALAYGAESTLY